MSKKKQFIPSDYGSYASIADDYITISTAPFQEWSDSDINLERWDKLEQKGKDGNSTEKYDTSSLYEDPQAVYLPPSLSMFAWKRPEKVFPQANIVIYIEREGLAHPELSKASRHLMECPFAKSFMSSIETLCFLGSTGRFSHEFVSHSFNPPFQDLPWRPWFHIYSKCKAGKNAVHAPNVNKIGKYIVRLYWLGAWRKIYVDDLLPINANDKVMLPSTFIPRSEEVTERTTIKGSRRQSSLMKQDVEEAEDVVELWPFLLSKALLKLASLTWYGNAELAQFDIIHSLTGWIPITYKEIDKDVIWAKLKKYSDAYTWADEQEENGQQDTHEPLHSCLILHSQKANEDSNDQIILPYNQAFLVYQTRDIPLTRPTQPEDYPLWKRFRWMSWAAEQHIIPPTEPTHLIRSLRVVDGLRDEFPKRRSVKSSHHHYSNDSTNRTRISKMLSNESKVQMEEIKDHISSWIDFNKICGQISHLIVYFKPSSFQVKVRLSNFIVDGLNKENKYPMYRKLSDSLSNQWVEIIKTLALKVQRNEPVYLCTDSTSEKNIIFNLVQIGNASVLQKKESIEHEEEIKEEESECGLCITTLLNRYRRNQMEKKPPEVVKRKEITYVPTQDEMLWSNVIINNYTWYLEKMNDLVANLKSYGCNSLHLTLKPGRQVLRFWIKSPDAYALHILADCPLVVGQLDLIFPMMSQESYSIQKIPPKINQAFAILVNSFGTPEYITALRDFCTTYIPDGEFSKLERTQMHDTYFKEFYNVIYNEIGRKEANALTILFKKWQREPQPFWEINELKFCYYLTEDMNFVDTLQQAALKIQALFKGHFERNMMKLHNRSYAKFKQIHDSLIVVNKEACGMGNKLTPKIFRNYLKNPEIEDVCRKFPFFDDMDNTVDIQEITQSVKISPGWVLICRQIFYVTAAESVYIRVCFFCDISVFVVRVFDNEKKEELKIYTNNVTCRKYQPNLRGYTVLCYGRANTNQQINYKLYFVISKGNNDKLLVLPTSQTKIESVSGVYLPTASNLLFTYNLIIKSDLLLSVRLTCSFGEAQLHLKLLDNDGELVDENFGQGSAIIPVVILDTVDDDDNDIQEKNCVSESSIKIKLLHSKSRSKTLRKTSNIGTRWTVEAYVINNSWPLTSSEWKIVKQVKDDMLFNTTFHNKVTKTNTLPNPTWTLQIITNTEDQIGILQDSSFQDNLMKMKYMWFKDPDKYAEAQRLRSQYLDSALVPNEECIKNSKHRDLKPDVFESYILPPFDITQHATVIDNTDDGQKVYKTAKDLNADDDEYFEKLDKLNQIISEETDSMMQKTLYHKDAIDKLGKSYLGARDESLQIMKRTYDRLMFSPLITIKETKS